MDTTKAITHIGLCAGYGGIELGLKRAIGNLRSVALCEIEGFAIANLVAKMEAGLMDPAPIWPDLKTFPWAAFRDRVDILTGGYPCQPFSAAGKRAGKDDPRHLWPWIAEGIGILRPRLCFFENVDGHISLGLRDVIEDLGRLGYRTTWGIFSASEVGAPHQRKRVFILAHRDGERGLLPDQWHLPAEQVSISPGSTWGNVWPSRAGQPQYGWEPPRVVGNTESQQDNGREPGDMGEEASQGGCGDHAADGAGEAVGDTDSSRAHGTAAPMAGEQHQEKGGEPQARDIAQAAWNDGDGAEAVADTSIIRSDGRCYGAGWWNREPAEAGVDATGSRSESDGVRQAEPPLGGDVDGPASGLDYAELCVTCDNRTDELRLLGNGVVPATAERAFRVLMEELMR